MSLRRTVPLSGLLVALLALSSCASSGSEGADSDRNLITQEQIADLGVSSAYEAIERIRPRWLRVRTPRSHNRATVVVVMVDNLQLESVEALRDVDSADVESIRWVDSAQAGRLPGLGSRHVQGAIVVETR